MSESYFINPINRKSIIVVYTEKNIKITIDSNGIQKYDNYFNIIIEKISLLNLMQIRLCDVNDQAKMYIFTIDNIIFEQIKNDQSLHVSYDGFVNHLTKILDSCKHGELQITLVKNQNIQILQFFEYGSFRNLMHLYIPVQEAPVNIILYHINQSILDFKQQTALYATQTHTLEREINIKDNHIIELTHEIDELKLGIQQQENQIISRNTEQISKLHQEIKHITDIKDDEIKKQISTINNLHDRIDRITKDNSLTNEKLSQEIKKSDILSEDNNQLKLKYTNVKELNAKLLGDIQNHKSAERKNDHLLSEARKQIHDLQEKSKQYDKQKNELAAEIEAEKHICQTKRNALHLATNEISKANEIILKQSKGIVELKRKIDWRTQIALQQELAIKEKDKEIFNLKNELIIINNKLKNNSTDTESFRNKLKSLQNLADEIENKYANKIDDLKTKVTQLNVEKTLNKNTNRYLKLSNRID